MAEIKVPFHRAAITKAEEDAVLDVLRSGWLTTGKYALEFEKKFSAAVSDTDKMKEARRKLQHKRNDSCHGSLRSMQRHRRYYNSLYLCFYRNLCPSLECRSLFCRC